uniref:Putative TMEM87A protein n=1 Tax=Phyllostachys edulis TaxID=38705 RepID=D3IVJ4_PHYED|nr:putative TMEM87A protein [Phyllostachys edulis]
MAAVSAAARLLLVLAAAALSPAVLRPGEASVHEYRGLGFLNKGNAFILHAGSEGLYAPASPADNATAGDDDTAAVADAFIRFDKITFRRPEDAVDSAKETSSAKVHIIVFEIEDREMIGGSAYGGQKAICCTSDLAKLGACTEGSVIYRPSPVNPGWPQLLVASFDGSDLISTLPSRTIPITKTGMYNMYFIHCDPSLAGLEIEGKTIWKNPTGYLPGRMAPLKNFFGLMSFAFVILGIYWFYQYMKFWREVLPLQNCITLVITLGMFEMALWYFEYAEFNETGVRPKGITFWAVTFGTVKRTVARFIILIVSMGYGVVRPTLGGLTSKVVMLGGTFFLATEILELVENLGTVNDLSGKARLFLVYPVAILDAAFVVWIFISLAKTLVKLQCTILFVCGFIFQARSLMAKLDIYRKFTIALAVTVLVSVGWIGYEVYFKSTDVFNERWQYAWIIPAFWHFLSFSLLCVISYLWAPSQSSMRNTFRRCLEPEPEVTITITKQRPPTNLNLRPQYNMSQPGTVQCHTCGGNHYQRECLQKPSNCYHCAQPGHFKLQCPMKNMSPEVAKVQVKSQPQINKTPPIMQANKGEYWLFANGFGGELRVETKRMDNPRLDKSESKSSHSFGGRTGVGLKGHLLVYTTLICFSMWLAEYGCVLILAKSTTEETWENSGDLHVEGFGGPPDDSDYWY